MSVESQLAQEQSNPDAVRGRVQEIADDYAKLAASCSAEINRKRRAVREKCQERLWVAAIWRDYHLEMAQKSYEAELKQIDKEHQLEFAALTDLLMQELQEERKRLQALESMEAQNGSQTLTIDKQGNLEEGGVGGLPAAVDDDAGLAAELAADSSSAGGRRLRRRELAALQASSLGADMPAFPGSQSQAGSAGARNPSNGAAASASGASRRKQAASNIYTYNTLLGDQEILDDLGMIAKDAGTAIIGPSRRSNKTVGSNQSSSNAPAAASANVAVQIEAGALMYNWDRLVVGDHLRIRDGPPATNPTVAAVISDISPGQVLFKLANGTVKLVNLLDLKNGKVHLALDDRTDHDELL